MVRRPESWCIWYPEGCNFSRRAHRIREENESPRRRLGTRWRAKLVRHASAPLRLANFIYAPWNSIPREKCLELRRVITTAWIYNSLVHKIYIKLYSELPEYIMFFKNSSATDETHITINHHFVNVSTRINIYLFVVHGCVVKVSRCIFIASR